MARLSVALALLVAVSAAGKPVNCGGTWGELGECSFKCGTKGIFSQKYKIHRPAKNGGMECLYAEGELRSKPCNRHACGCGKVYCQWKKNNFGYRKDIHKQSIQVFHHDLENWGKKHHCALSSKSSSADKKAHMVPEGQENCRCMCHNKNVDDVGNIAQKGAFREWLDNEDNKYKITKLEKSRLPEAVVHSMQFFPGVKPIYEPPAKGWKECQEACRNLKSCKSWSMYTEAKKVYGSTCRVYDIAIDNADTCDFTIPNFWTNGNFPCTVHQKGYGFQNVGAKSSYGGIDRLTDVSDKTCKKLGWDVTNWGTEYQNTQAVCGGRPDCKMKAKTYKQAAGFCKAQGARLCTLAETQANEAAGTGCGFDKIGVWTSTPCKNKGDHYYVTLGNERWRRTATKEVEKTVHCMHASAQTASADKKYNDGTYHVAGFLELGVQCCADQVPCEGRCVNNGEAARAANKVGTSGYTTGHITSQSGASGVFLDRAAKSHSSYASEQSSSVKNIL